MRNEGRFQAALHSKTCRAGGAAYGTLRDNHYLTRARKDDKRTFIAARQTERGHGANDSEDIVREDGYNFAESRVRPMEGQTRSRSGDDVLFFGASKLPQNGLCSSGRRL